MNSTIVIIPVSKKKVLKLTIGSFAFVLIGTYILLVPNTRYDTTTMMAFGWITILFFGGCLLFGVSRLLSKKPGIVFDSNGFSDFTSYLGGIKVDWYDVADIRPSALGKQYFVTILLKDPNVVLNKVTGLKRFLMQQNLKYYDSPIHITANNLDMPFERLVEEFLKKWQTWRNRAQHGFLCNGQSD